VENHKGGASSGFFFAKSVAGTGGGRRLGKSQVLRKGSEQKTQRTTIEKAGKYGKVLKETTPFGTPNNKKRTTEGRVGGAHRNQKAATLKKCLVRQVSSALAGSSRGKCIRSDDRELQKFKGREHLGT